MTKINRLIKFIAPALFVLPLLVFSAGEAEAQSQRIGYTDQELIIAQMPEYRNILQQLQGIAEGHQTEYRSKVEDFQRKLEDYQRKQALMSDEARQSREQELTEAQATIQSFLQEKEQEMGEKEIELLRPLLQRVENAINEVARERNLDMVIGVRAGQSPIVLYVANDEMDITADVMSRLGLQPQAADPGAGQ